MLFWTACVDLAGDEMAQLANQGGYALHDKLIGRRKMKKRKMNDDSIVAQPEFESEQSVMEHAILPSVVAQPDSPSPSHRRTSGTSGRRASKARCASRCIT